MKRHTPVVITGYPNKTSIREGKEIGVSDHETSQPKTPRELRVGPPTWRKFTQQPQGRSGVVQREESKVQKSYDPSMGIAGFYGHGFLARPPMGKASKILPMWTTCGPVTSMQSPRASTKDSGRRVEYVDDGGWRGNHTFDRIRHRAWIYTLVPDTRCTDRDHMQSNSDPRPPPPRCWDRLRIHSESPLELRGEPGTLPSAHYAQSPTCSAITSYVQRGRL